MSLRLVIAVRGGPEAKSRLAATLSSESRAALIEAMLADMLAAAAVCRVVQRTYVVTPTPALARLAAEAGAVVILEREPRGLNAAFETARQRLADLDPAGPIALLPGDLPRLHPADLEDAATRAADDTVVIVRSQSDGGTGAIVQPAGLALPLTFGRDSFCRHCGAAAGLGLAVSSPALASLSLDVDRGIDLHRLTASANAGRAAALARALTLPAGAAA
ncbi:MAG: 2-phospho-L-lactate guanylyltransferase [Phenylobacterium sp.]